MEPGCVPLGATLAASSCTSERDPRSTLCLWLWLCGSPLSPLCALTLRHRLSLELSDSVCGLGPGLRLPARQFSFCLFELRDEEQFSICGERPPPAPGGFSLAGPTRPLGSTRQSQRTPSRARTTPRARHTVRVKTNRLCEGGAAGPSAPPPPPRLRPPLSARRYFCAVALLPPWLWALVELFLSVQSKLWS